MATNAYKAIKHVHLSALYLAFSMGNLGISTTVRTR